MECALMFQFYEKGIALKDKTKSGLENMGYECKTCNKPFMQLKVF
jgi:hypothetical protein